MLDNIEKDLLEKVSGIKDKPKGAYNIRVNSKAVDRASSENITITKKKTRTVSTSALPPAQKRSLLHSCHNG